MSAVPGAQAAAPLHSSSGVYIREATVHDLIQVREIYAHHVLSSTATFEEEPPTLQEMEQRFRSVREKGLPWLVAEHEGRVVGYCYASSYRPRPAYRYTIEDSVYVADGQSGKGIGHDLLSALIAHCERGPWRQMIAVIGGTQNQGSVALHRKLGFAHVGTQPATGYKFGRWIDVVFMQRALVSGGNTPPDD